MSEPHPPGDPPSLATLRAVVEAGDRFEDEWLAARRPRIEDFLGRAAGPLRPDLLRHLLRLELEYRSRAGERPGEDEYHRRFPDQTEVVRGAFRAEASGQEATDEWRRKDQEKVADEPDLPAVIGKYRVVEYLGRGAQGDVYRAVHPALGRDVVLKRPRAGLPEHACRKLLDEARILTLLDDPGLVRVLDADLDGGRPFVVFEYVSGRCLAEVLRQGRPSPRRAAALVAELAGTLGRAHRRGALHRDLKPANVLIDSAGRPRLLDFGLACLARAWDTIGSEEEISGTPAYMAPEQARGDTGALGPRTDVFGLGALLYHLLTGRPPYRGPTVEDVLGQARQGRVAPPRQVEPGVPRALERVCRKALAPDPGQRYAGAAEMGRALRAYLRRGRLAALGLLLAALVLAGTLAWAFGPGRQAGPPGEANGAGAALDGDLVVRVWSEDGEAKPGLTVDQDGALPVRDREMVQVEARLNRPGHVYLLWVGSTGKVTPLYPWNDGPRLTVKGPGATPPERGARAVVRSPPDTAKGWRVGGKGGLETILMAARRTPLEGEVSLARLVGGVPAAPFHHPQEWARLRGVGEGEVLRAGGHRDPEDEAGEIDHPVMRVMARLREHFEVVRAVRFAHQAQ